MKKRVGLFLVLAAMLAGCLAGCGNNSAEAEQNALVSKYAYQASFFDFEVDEANQFQGVEQYCISGSYVFFSGSCVTDRRPMVNAATGEPVLDEETGEQIVADIYETCLFRMDFRTRETVQLDYLPAEPPEGTLGYTDIMRMSAGLDGTFWIMESMNTYSYDLPEDFDSKSDQIGNYYVPGENLVFLHQYDADGCRLKTLDLSGIVTEPLEMHFDADGNIYLSSNGHTDQDVLYLLDSEGTLLAKQTCSSFGEICQISATEIGDLAYLSGKLRLIDPAARDYGKNMTVPLNAMALYPGMENYQYLYEDLSGEVYGVVAETGEPEKLFSWLECDVDGSRIESFAVLEDGSVAAVMKKSEAPVQYGLVYMERVDPSALPQKQVLTLACMYVSSDVSRAVLQFNQSHSSVQIVIEDYSQYNTAEDTSAGLTRLNTEILAGKFPDLICTENLPVDQYAARGILVDLWPLIDGDESINREDLMTHLFDVMSIDGKLYQITSDFAIQTAFGRADVIGDRTGWTLEEMREAMTDMEDASAALGTSSTKTGVLKTCVTQSFEAFINWEDQTCSFDSPEFMEILNFANAFPAEFSGDAAETTPERFRNGRQLLCGSYIDEFNDMQFHAALVGGEPCYVGFPSSTGSGNAFRINGGLAITAACQNADAAWSFLRTFLTEEYQSEISKFPTNRHAFEAYVEKSMSQVSGGTSTDLTEGISVEYKALSRQDYDTFLRLYESCDSLYIQNDIVYQIIEAEAAPFFDGQKTVEEAAALIQNRVGLYVMEQK